MKKIVSSSFVISALLSTAVFAQASNVKPVEAFKNGLNVDAITACEQKYLSVCPSAKLSDGKMEKYMSMQSCLEKQLAKDKACAQASEIRHLTYQPATAFKKYGKVTVFYSTTLADGVDMFYMVDTKGQLITLKDNINLLSDKTYQAIKAKYPATTLTTMLDITKQTKDIFPADKVTPKGQQIIFQQTLKDGGCVSCARVGVVDVAYEFNAAGEYQGAKFLKVTQR